MQACFGAFFGLMYPDPIPNTDPDPVDKLIVDSFPSSAATSLKIGMHTNFFLKVCSLQDDFL
jgi:hypothetical protein